MSELIKKALRVHAGGEFISCPTDCPFIHKTNCPAALCTGALSYIDTLEKRLECLTAQCNDLKEKLRMAQDYAEELEKQLDGGMSREDKIIDGLERCQDGTPESCEGCGYSRFNDCGTALMADSLELIKELLEK